MTFWDIALIIVLVLFFVWLCFVTSAVNGLIATLNAKGGILPASYSYMSAVSAAATAATGSPSSFDGGQRGAIRGWWR